MQRATTRYTRASWYNVAYAVNMVSTTIIGVTEEQYLTVRVIARRLAVHEATVRRWLEAGELRGYRLPGGWRVSEKSLQEFLEKRRERAEE